MLRITSGSGEATDWTGRGGGRCPGGGQGCGRSEGPPEILSGGLPRGQGGQSSLQSQAGKTKLECFVTVPPSGEGGWPQGGPVAPGLLADGRQGPAFRPALCTHGPGGSARDRVCPPSPPPRAAAGTRV